jgi:hypothetical protein
LQEKYVLYTLRPGHSSSSGTFLSEPPLFCHTCVVLLSTRIAQHHYAALPDALLALRNLIPIPIQKGASCVTTKTNVQQAAASSGAKPQAQHKQAHCAHRALLLLGLLACTHHAISSHTATDNQPTHASA